MKARVIGPGVAGEIENITFCRQTTVDQNRNVIRARINRNDVGFAVAVKIYCFYRIRKLPDADAGRQYIDQIRTAQGSRQIFCSVAGEITPESPETTMSDGYNVALVGAVNPELVPIVMFCVFEKTVCDVLTEPSRANP